MHEEAELPYPLRWQTPTNPPLRYAGTSTKVTPKHNKPVTTSSPDPVPGPGGPPLTNDNDPPVVDQVGQKDNPFWSAESSADASIGIDMFKHGSSVYVPSEYRLLAHVFKKLTSPDTPPAVQDWMKILGRGTSHQLSALTGTGERTCRKAVAFAETGSIDKEEIDRPGRPLSELDENLAAKIRDIITRSNKKTTPLVEGPEEDEENYEEMVLSVDLMGEEAWTRALEVVNAADPYENGNLFIMEPSSTDDLENDRDDVHDGYAGIGDDGVEICLAEDGLRK
ncbi:hypothetical protein BC939DRAFT_492077 [Gamsiella multidivaricata]|uniref:uncharacterized protein n=1 Tax=Gamsiella multidivaricata TaxID=101098 RepID=UPI002220D37C|nr:uncharacterized protein BC939DRAFT_492077 [Gamsiella multidivaricata]KAI7825696.1 hypothetical protein BC939DRAFT_492077 [Gamsiella multidivaricata]